MAKNKTDESTDIDELGPCPVVRAAGRPRASETEARTRELMHTAFQLFLEKGYSKVSLEMIARKAHVAVRTIYVKFGGKSGLFREILKTGRDAAFESMEDLGTIRSPVRDVLQEFGLRMYELITSGTVTQLHRLVIAEAHHDRELAEAFFEAGPQRTRDALHRYFSRPDVRAQLRDLPAEVLAIHFMNCLMGDQLKRYLFMPPTQAEPVDPALVAQRVDLFLNGASHQAP